MIKAAREKRTEKKGTRKERGKRERKDEERGRRAMESEREGARGASERDSAYLARRLLHLISVIISPLNGLPHRPPKTGQALVCST